MSPASNNFQRSTVRRSSGEAKRTTGVDVETKSSAGRASKIQQRQTTDQSVPVRLTRIDTYGRRSLLKLPRRAQVTRHHQSPSARYVVRQPDLHTTAAAAAEPSNSTHAVRELPTVAKHSFSKTTPINILLYDYTLRRRRTSNSWKARKQTYRLLHQFLQSILQTVIMIVDSPIDELY